MATAKKFHREGDAYAGYRHAVEEEFGDALWYFTALCRRLSVRVDEILADPPSEDSHTDSVATPLAVPELDATLLSWEKQQRASRRPRLGQQCAAHTCCLWRLVSASPQGFAPQLLRSGSQERGQTRGRFLNPDRASLPTFDEHFLVEEQLPNHFEITIDQRNGGRSYLRWHGVFIGDPLTDNILDRDGYRFHDVFHFAHAAILHWSPTFRALIKQKRKSDPWSTKRRMAAARLLLRKASPHGFLRALRN